MGVCIGRLSGALDFAQTAWTTESIANRVGLVHTMQWTQVMYIANI